MATRVDCGGIKLASFNSPFPKTFHQTQRSCRYLLQYSNYSPFFLNFVAMETRVGRGKILLAVFDGPTPNPSQTQKSCKYLQQKPSCSKFRCQGNHAKSGQNFIGSIPQPNSVNPPIDAKISQISLAEAELWLILFQISLSWQPGRG